MKTREKVVTRISASLDAFHRVFLINKVPPNYINYVPSDFLFEYISQSNIEKHWKR